MFTVQAKEFGPIKEGSVSLRPLTIFIGPNNVGKSYLAILIYALFNSFGRHSFGRSPYWNRYLSLADELSPTEDVKKWFFNRRKQKQAIRFDELPENIKKYHHKAVTKFILEVATLLKQELQHCFNSELADLVRKRSKYNFHLSVEQSKPLPLSNFELTLKNGNLQVVTQKFDVSEQEFDFTGTRESPIPMLDEPQWQLFKVVIDQVFRNFFGSSYYFPAARSGILQTHKVLASVIVSRSPLMGIGLIEIPKLSGIVADFISNLLRLERRLLSNSISEVAAFLESEVGQGKIDMQATEVRFEYPEIYYELDGEKFPLHRSSSMVSEIAPIVLFLKYAVEKGDLLIIEEPEAHLHPDNQRTLARAIVKLIRSGVQVLVTTHSDYFLQQISNFIRLSQAADERTKLGYSEDDYLSAQEVATYLFYFDEKARGSLVQELEVTEEDGIPEDEFVKIAEAIYRETVRLQRLDIKS